MSIGEAAREKIEAFQAGDVVERGTSEVDTTGTDNAETVEERGVAATPEADTEKDAAAVSPTEEEEDAAEEAADAAADALPDDATEEERETARQEARDEFYAGTYRTREDAEKGIAEQNLTIDRLFSEKNTLERRLQEVEAAKQQEPIEIDVPAWDQWAAEQVAAGAGEAGAMAALREGGYDGYQVYLRHWMSAVDEDGVPNDEQRAKALLYNNEVVMSIAEVRAAAASERARQQPSAAESRENAHSIVKEKRPDFDNYANEMTEVVSELPEGDVSYLRSLAEQGAEGQAKALDWIYLEAKSRGSRSAEAQKVERQRRKTSAAAATVAATSVSAEGTSSRTPPPAAEAEGIRRKAGLRARQNLSIDDGLDAD